MQLFRTKKEMKGLLKKFGSVEKKLESHVHDGFRKNKLLVTAEHAMTQRRRVNGNIIGIGERNTGWIARLAAYYARCAYTIPKIPRYHADPARPPGKLGRGVHYRARVPGKREGMKIRIHENEDYKPHLKHYRNFVRELSPNAIMSVHGVGGHHIKKHDVILGFGRRKEFINEDPKKFRNELSERLKDALKEVDLDKYPSIKKDVRIAIGRRRYTGTSNYILRTMVGKTNRIGVHVEFLRRGRNIKGHVSAEFQLLGQVMAGMLAERSEQI